MTERRPIQKESSDMLHLVEPLLATHLAEGDMVVCPNGRVGLLAELRTEPYRCAVQFGADGSIVLYAWRSLRRATGKEIVLAGLLGVGCSADQAQAASEYERELKRRAVHVRT